MEVLKLNRKRTPLRLISGSLGRMPLQRDSPDATWETRRNSYGIGSPLRHQAFMCTSCPQLARCHPTTLRAASRAFFRSLWSLCAVPQPCFFTIFCTFCYKPRSAIYGFQKPWISTTRSRQLNQHGLVNVGWLLSITKHLSPPNQQENAS